MRMVHLTAALALAVTVTVAIRVANAEDMSHAESETQGSILLFPGKFGALVSYSNQDPNAGAPGSKAGWHIPGGKYRSGDGWWALVCDQEQKTADKKPNCSLHKTQLSVARALHGVYDSEPVGSQLLHWSPLPGNLDKLPREGEKRPLLIAVFKPEGRLADLNLNAGSVVTYVHNGMDQYPSTQRAGTLEVRLPMGNELHADVVPRIKLSARSAQDRMSIPSPDIASFELRIGQQRQQLPGFAFSALTEGFGSLSRQDFLLWAGDLDGDGRPDLILNHGEAGVHVALYLSSLAGNGELVGVAGVFQFSDPSSAGC